jgi:eukaryotic-like serine/threonine-protein kinase
VLADLAHPNIARLLDGGSDSFGRPYLVMELVEGVPITEAVRARGISIHRLVEIICQTCDAIEAAHRRMIVHCDIKPSNLLVTSSGEVRLLDFGIAQILADDDSGGGNTSFAREDLRCSVAYASPEQLRGERPTAAVDIHALGLVLKESIAAIDEVNPLPVGDREDLDAIARVATAPQAADRYLSVETLRLDLLRWMRREPVRARVTPWLRRTTLFCRRNASGVIAAGFVTLACAITLWAIIASLIATAGARDAERLAANRAAEEALVSESVSLFLQDLLGSVEPAVALGRDTALVSDMLNRAAARLDEDVALPERARATIDLTLGEAYRDLASYERAEMHLTRALATLRSNEADDEAIAQAAQRLAMLSVDTDRFDQARVLFEEVVRLRSSHDPAHPLLGEAWRGLAQVERDVGRYDEAERAGLEALRIERQHGDASGLIAALLERGSLLAWVQRLDEARVVVEEACASRCASLASVIRRRRGPAIASHSSCADQDARPRPSLRISRYSRSNGISCTIDIQTSRRR